MMEPKAVILILNSVWPQRPVTPAPAGLNPPRDADMHDEHMQQAAEEPADD